MSNLHLTSFFLLANRVWPLLYVEAWRYNERLSNVVKSDGHSSAEIAKAEWDCPGYYFISPVFSSVSLLLPALVGLQH